MQKSEITEIFPKNIVVTVKCGRDSVMVWGCFSNSEVGKLVFIDGIMNSVAYVDSLANNLRLSTEKMKVKNIYFSTRSRSEIYINTCRERLYQKKNQADSLAATVPRFKPNIDTCVIVKRKYLN